MGNHTNNPNHQANSLEAIEVIRKHMELASQTASKILADNAATAANKIVSLSQVDCLLEPEARGANIALQASKYTLKIVGLEVERTELSGKDGSPIMVYLPPQDGGEAK